MKIFEKPLTAEEEKECLLRLNEGDLAAQDILVQKNMRLVAHMVKKYASSDAETEDMISVGTIGLIKAIKSFDVNKGSRFATYAAKCIDNELLMMLRSNKKKSREVSLNEPVGTDKEGNEVSIIDFLECQNGDVYKIVEMNSQVQRLKEAILKCLSPREIQVISLRYGLNGTKEKTQNDIAGMLGISRSYVSRIEKKALNKLLKEMEND